MCMGFTGFRASAEAQERVTLAVDVLLYGDNTEFRNPFREGETLFGAAPRLSILFGLGDQALLELGVFANQRFGSDRASEVTRPVIALKVHRRSSSFVFGTLDTPRVIDPAGPDRAGAHGLLPPLQIETLAFQRAYEAGLQWIVKSERFRNDAWLSWQQLNTPDHRERLNAGVNSELTLSRIVALPIQFHIVHHGGQQFASGPVADSYAGAAGIAAQRALGHLTGRAELVGALSRHVPDRELPDRSRSGRGLFTRTSLAAGGWRGHLLFWRGRDFIKEEGDANYQSIRRNGSYYTGTRDYAETGLTRLFKPVPQVRIEVSARIHRVEKQYAYSYRVVGVTTARVVLKGR